MLIETTILDRDAQLALDRLAVGSDMAVRRGLLRIGFLLGRKTAQNIEEFKETVGTRRLSRSFLIPHPEGLGVILGEGAPVYAAIHEYGGTIHAKNAPYLVFQTADGVWHSVKQVEIKEKRYARDAIEDVQHSGEAAIIMGTEIAKEWHAGS